MSYTRALGLARALGISGPQARLGGQLFFIVVRVAPDKSHDSPKHIQANCLPTVRDGMLWLSIVRGSRIFIFRGVQIQSLPSNASQNILNKQRLRRPSSPHFTIYQPQLTWISSIANRFTGVGLSVREYSSSISVFCP